MRRIGLMLTVVILSLSLGAVIYFITRSENIYLNQWLSQFNNGKALFFFQHLFANSQLPDWIIYSLPDGLWMFGLVTIILLLWDFRLNKHSMLWIFLATCTGIFFEVFQALGFVRGSFDWTDLLFIVLAAVIPLLFARNKSRLWAAS